MLPRESAPSLLFKLRMGSTNDLSTDQGQGGAQAIEDGAALGALFALITSKEDIPRVLGIFQNVRHNRASAIQCLSNVGYDEAGRGTAENLLQQYIVGPVPSMHSLYPSCVYPYTCMYTLFSLLINI